MASLVRVAEGAVAAVEEQPVGAVVAGQVDVLPAVVVEVGVAGVERPAGVVGEARLLGHLDEAHPMPPGSVLASTLRHSVTPPPLSASSRLSGSTCGVGQIDQVDRLEIVAEQQVEPAVVVIVEGDGRDRVAELVEPRAGGHVLELAARPRLR